MRLLFIKPEQWNNNLKAPPSHPQILLFIHICNLCCLLISNAVNSGKDFRDLSSLFLNEQERRVFSFNYDMLSLHEFILLILNKFVSISFSNFLYQFFSGIIKAMTHQFQLLPSTIFTNKKWPSLDNCSVSQQKNYLIIFCQNSI